MSYLTDYKQPKTITQTMKKFFLYALSAVSFFSCATAPESDPIAERLAFSVDQTRLMMDAAIAEGKNPRTLKADGSMYWIKERGFDWTEGFFPGTLWYLYEWSGDEAFKAGATTTQNYFADDTSASSHDLGFVFNCSYGNGYRLTGDTTMLNKMIAAGNTLIGRYSPITGTILSWDTNRGWQATRGWDYAVIIDNMMNLEMLFELSGFTGDDKYKDVAIAHANTTLKAHFRDDWSSYHVVDYDRVTGEVRNRHTAQGYAHESSWARGQAWGLYGYVTCYRYTKDPVYLEAAENIAKYIMTAPEIPADKVPYWDYDAPKIPNEPRDVSAATVTASALIELEGYVAEKGYLKYATDILDAVSSEAYRASELGANSNFILMHSVGSIPHNNEIDVPLNYADYYYVEALLRLQRVEKGEPAFVDFQ